MKISLFFTGKTSAKYINEGINEYEKRIKRYIKFEILIIPDLKSSRNMPVKIYKLKEGNLLLNKILKSDILVLLDEKAKDFTSLGFAKYIENKMITGTKHLIFVVGGAYGFSEEVKKRANFKISLSKMTFSHQSVRILFMEQLYRAFTIIKGEPYHNS